MILRVSDFLLFQNQLPIENLGLIIQEIKEVVLFNSIKLQPMSQILYMTRQTPPVPSEMRL